jgi:hypothetical protein
MYPTVRAVVGIALSLLIVVLSAAPAAGETHYVSQFGNDFGGCSASDPCQTISRAVFFAAPGDTIKVGYGTFVERHGITIDKSLTISGNGSLFATVVRPQFEDNPFPVFKILAGATVQLTGMMIYRGSGTGLVPGGIQNSGSLTLNDVRIFNNSSDHGTAGILNDDNAWLVMVRVGLEHNQGREGLMNLGTAIVLESWITGTRGATSAGVANAGTLLMERSLIAGNEGYGIANYRVSARSQTTVLTNVTVSGNSAAGVQANGGQMILTHVTVAANPKEGLLVTAGLAALRNSIVATNGSDCSVFGDGDLSAFHSLLADASCAGASWPTNLIGVDPKLSALTGAAAANRWMRTHRLLPGSPAIDAAAALFCEPTDQRGIQRPLDGDGDGTATCDIGAYEYVPPQRGRPWGSPRGR